MVPPLALHSEKDIDEFVARAGDQFDLLLRTNSLFAVPALSLKERVKAAVLESRWRDIVTVPKVYKWPDFVVLRRNNEPVAQMAYPARVGPPTKAALGLD